MKKYEYLNEIALLIFRIKTLFLEKGDQLVAPLGLTSARWQILGAIALTEDPVTVPQIAEFMGMSRQGVQKQINLMLESKLCESLINPQHERSKLYVLTPKGKEIFHSAMVLSNKWMAQLGEEITIGNLKVIFDNLHILQKRLEEINVPFYKEREDD